MLKMIHYRRASRCFLVTSLTKDLKGERNERISIDLLEETQNLIKTNLLTTKTEENTPLHEEIKKNSISSLK